MKKPTLDTYLDLCTQVYDLSKPKPSENAYQLYHYYCSQARGPILEPMCGTGRYLLPLIKDGFDVHGFDASAHMLNALHAKAKALQLKPQVWKGFVADLKLEAHYDLVFIPAGSFGLITDLAAVKQAIEILYRHLNAGGVFVFEIETLKAVPTQPNTWRGSFWPCPDGKQIIASFLDLSPENDVCTTICKYELLDGNNIIQSEVELLKVRLFDPILLKELLQSAGFSQVRFLKAFDSATEADLADELVVVECRK